MQRWGYPEGLHIAFTSYPPCTTARFTQFPVRQLQMALPDRPIKASTHHQQAGKFGGGRSYDILLSLLTTPNGKPIHLLHTGANKQSQARKWRLDTDIALGQDRIGQALKKNMTDIEGLVCLCGCFLSGSKQLRMSTTFWEVVSLKSSFLFCLFGTDSIMELKALWNFQGSWKMRVSSMAERRPWSWHWRWSDPFTGHTVNNVDLSHKVSV